MQADGTLSFLEGHLAIAVRRKLGHVLDSLETDTKTALVGSSNTANFARIWHNFAATAECNRPSIRVAPSRWGVYCCPQDAKPISW
jgi:hypothetical protein